MFKIKKQKEPKTKKLKKLQKENFILKKKINFFRRKSQRSRFEFKSILSLGQFS